MTVKQVPLVDYLHIGARPYLKAKACTSCGARFFDRRIACGNCGAQEFENALLCGASAEEGMAHAFERWYESIELLGKEVIPKLRD